MVATLHTLRVSHPQVAIYIWSAGFVFGVWGFLRSYRRR